ncbi:MAG TPA: hypothetical protein VLH10_09420 [Yinghuangia sp.]|uniref:hypothetical protein n=1 Tax=Yinghuangia sp. YIM S10712 TaxID=3436930 RepID=UPI002BAB1BF0|nr:hypothetical protein [Yinghuangia sp.]
MKRQTVIRHDLVVASDNFLPDIEFAGLADIRGLGVAASRAGLTAVVRLLRDACRVRCRGGAP